MALNVSGSISDTDEKLLLNDLLHIQDWVDGALTGKINSCWGRFKREWTTKLLDDETVTAISASKSDFVEQVRHLKAEGVRVEIAAVKSTTAKILLEEASYFHQITEGDWFVYKAPQKGNKRKGKRK